MGKNQKVTSYESLKKITANIAKNYKWDKHKQVKMKRAEGISVELFMFFKGELLKGVNEFLDDNFDELSLNDIMLLHEDDTSSIVILSNRFFRYRIAKIPRDIVDKLIFTIP